MKPLATLMAMVLFGLCVVACGNTGNKGGGFVSQTSANASASATSASGARPTLHHILSDYDNDDYESNQYGGDGDDDDISGYTDRDGDSDNKSNSYYDGDDNNVRGFGHAASRAGRHAITALTKRYYAATAADDGANACSMMASALAKAIPEDQGRPPGPPYLRGKTCAVVMSKLFKQYHRQLAAYVATLDVDGVRISGGRGLAVLRFTTLPGRQIAVEREHGVWKIDALLDEELP